MCVHVKCFQETYAEDAESLSPPIGAAGLSFRTGSGHGQNVLRKVVGHAYQSRAEIGLREQ